MNINKHLLNTFKTFRKNQFKRKVFDKKADISLRKKKVFNKRSDSNDQSNEKNTRQNQTLFKNEKEVNDELNIMTKWYYMTFLFNQIVDEFIKAVFFEMKIIHNIFKKACQKIIKSYKEWKTVIFIKAVEFTQKWI